MQYTWNLAKANKVNNAYVFQFSLFKNVHEIPDHLIMRNKTLRGIAKEVVSHDVIKVQHLPIFFRNLEARKEYFGEFVF